MIHFLLLLLNLISPSQAKLGFAGGSKLTAHSISGAVKVACEGFNGVAANTFTCTDNVLSGMNLDYFRGPIGGNGDSLELIAQSGGQTEAYIVPYNTRIGSSIERVNLWLQGPFSRPLLKTGSNEVKVRVFEKKTGKTHYFTKMDIEVAEGKALTCPAATYESSDANDCHSKYNICQKYFREHKYCQP